MKRSEHLPRFTLVGAGPGDPELISIKGAKAIQKADAILYDALIHKELLDFARKDIPKTFVGKRAGFTGTPQTEINQLIIDYAFRYGHVIRLKGGDPMIFGRGSEEIEYANKFGIPSEVIPGISSATGITSMMKIPVTKRNINQSFWVITGTTKTGELSYDIPMAAQSKATIIILMGVKKLREIVSIYKSFGRMETPIALIQDGTLHTQKVALGTIDNILFKVRAKKIRTPAIIVIGEVLNTVDSFSAFDNLQILFEKKTINANEY